MHLLRRECDRHQLESSDLPSEVRKAGDGNARRIRAWTGAWNRRLGHGPQHHLWRNPRPCEIARRHLNAIDIQVLPQPVGSSGDLMPARARDRRVAGDFVARSQPQYRPATHQRENSRVFGRRIADASQQNAFRPTAGRLEPGRDRPRRVGLQDRCIGRQRPHQAAAVHEKASAVRPVALRLQVRRSHLRSHHHGRGSKANQGNAQQPPTKTHCRLPPKILNTRQFTNPAIQLCCVLPLRAALPACVASLAI